MRLGTSTPRLVRLGSLVPAKDGLADTVFQGKTLHTPVEEQWTEVPTAEQVVKESVNSFGVEVKETEEEMVVHRNITAARFLPGGRLAAQQQQQTPSPPCNRKRPCETEQTQRRPKETPSRIPPALAIIAVVIREPTSGTRPTVQVGSNAASSSSLLAAGWHTTFLLSSEPLLMASTVRN